MTQSVESNYLSHGKLQITCNCVSYLTGNYTGTNSKLSKGRSWGYLFSPSVYFLPFSPCSSWCPTEKESLTAFVVLRQVCSASPCNFSRCGNAWKTFAKWDFQAEWRLEKDAPIPSLSWDVWFCPSSSLKRGAVSEVCKKCFCFCYLMR